MLALQSWGKRASDVRRKIASLKSQTLSPHVPLDDDTVKSVRLIHDLADWTCAAGRIRKEEGDQQRDKLFRKNIDDHELVNNWFVSQPVQVKASDLNSFHGLIAANRSSYLSGDASSEQNPIAHLALVPYVRDCEGRLVDSADLYLKQHRIVLWSMRATISGADGKMLHAAI